jgi:A/G-specific adenine glycosylase
LERTAGTLVACSSRDRLIRCGAGSGLPVEVATVVALDRGRVLLVAQPKMSLLALPGGKLERGETPRDAARRELAEETGIVVAPDQLTDLGLRLDVSERLTLWPFAIANPPPRSRESELRCIWINLERLHHEPLVSAVARSVHAALARLAKPDTPSSAAARTLVAWWERNQLQRPWRETRDPYAVLVCEVMSQQTQVARVADYWQRWIERWPTVESLSQASLADVLGAWQGLGYPRRARYLHAAARQIVRDGWPAPERLTELAGVGPYTAAAIRCFALEHSEMPLDANVRRVLARRFPSGLAPGAAAWVLGQAMMELGQRHCRSTPQCEDCPMRPGCLVALDGEGWDPAPRPRRQAAYRGSLRERRGRLLRAVLAGERLRDSGDGLAATTLIADGLLRSVDGWLAPPDL